MPVGSSSLAEAQRQFLVCSACRYCEGYCATFPAIEGRVQWSAPDVAYIANLCHDCRACAQACMYMPPHEFAVDIPRLLGGIRIETYRNPASAAVTPAAAAIALVALLSAIALTGRWPAFVHGAAGAGAFYGLVPYLWMLVPALVLSAWIALVWGSAMRALVRDALPAARSSAREWWGALRDGVELVYLRGGGGGCYYPDATPSPARRILHLILVAGVALAFAATVAAAVMQDALGALPPYPAFSAPVVLGTAGGVAIVIGAAGLLWLKRAPNAPSASAPGMTALDVVFLVTLIVVALTGLLLLALRATPLLGPLLVLHLAAVAGLFVTAPYGKFMHVPLRLAALFVFRTEEARRASGSPQ